MKTYITKPTKVRGTGNLHSLRQEEEYEEIDCTKVNLGKHSFEGIENNEYELTSTENTTRLKLTASSTAVYLGKETYTLTATFTDENGDPITNSNGVYFYINNNLLQGDNPVSLNSQGQATYTGITTATNTGTWVFTAKTTKNNITYNSNQVLITALKRPTQISYLDTVKQGTNYTGRLIDTITEQGIPKQSISIRISRNDGESKTYTLTTDNNGYFNIPINLNLGEYWFKITYGGTGIYEATTTDTFKVTVNNELRQSLFKNIRTEVPHADYFEAQLVDKETEQPITDQAVNITLSRTNTQSTTDTNSSRTYTITTDENGYCKLQINLALGTYLFNLEYAGNNTYEPTSTLNNKLIVINNDKETTYITSATSVTQYTNYTGILLDSTGEPIPNQNVQITICRQNGEPCKTYGTGEIDSEGNVDTLITTDSDGVFGKYITLSPGVYQFKCVFQGTDEYQATNTGTVYVTVIEKVKEASHIIAEDSVYTGTNITGYLVTDGGEGISNRTVNIRISEYDDTSQYADYTVTTDSNGEFTLPVTLTVEGEYRNTLFTYTFDGSDDATYNSTQLGPILTKIYDSKIMTTLTLLNSTVSNGGYLEFELKDENNDGIEGADISITLYREYISGEHAGTEESVTYTAERNGFTNSNGIVRCAWSISPNANSKYYASAVFETGEGYMGSSVSKTELTVLNTTTNLNLTRNPSGSSVSLGSSMNLTALLQDSNNNAVSDADITLNWTHSLLDIDISLSASGSVVTATVVDEDNDAVVGLSVGFYDSDDALLGTATTDSSGVCSFDCSGASSVYCVIAETSGYEGVTSTSINLEVMLYNPLLDGSEELRIYSSRTLFISDNMLQGTGGLLVEGWDNTGDWILTLDYYLQGVDGEGLGVNPTTNTLCNMCGGLGMHILNYGQGFGVANRRSTNADSETTRLSSRIGGWFTLVVTKSGSSFEVVTNNTTSTYTNVNLSNAPRCTVGIDRWNNGTVRIKNIRVVSL